MFDAKGRYVIENYSRKSPFASFLPGIAGQMGIPVWCFYVNRGQAVCSFGSEDKEHSIMEFYPAHQAYQLTSTLGFRTFLKIDGLYYEPFRSDNVLQKMFIGMNELALEETNETLGIQVNVRYFTLPQEDVGGLVRTVTIKNISETKKIVEILDGMPAVMTYGTSQSLMKAMGQTAKAWMQVEDAEKGTPYYRVRFSTDDSAMVKQVNEGNFYLAFDEEGQRLPVIVDPEIIFAYNTAMTEATSFCETGVEELLRAKQVTQNQVPCGFLGRRAELQGQSEATCHSVIGHASSKAMIAQLAVRCARPGYFTAKAEEAVSLTKDLCRVIKTKTADPIFDAYCEQTYLDNLLRGGYPIPLGNDSVFYLYARKHGDIERDYNFFKMLPEFYSQGNANFRDVNQNRRSDVLFAPYVKDANIKKFYDLIQLDGYNPLSVETEEYTMLKDRLPDILACFEEKDQSDIAAFFVKPYTPGRLAGFLRHSGIKMHIPIHEMIDKAASCSEKLQHARFGEGYWTDHWTYNLDLVETYLAVYPDREEKLLFEDVTYTWFTPEAGVNPRKKRYQLTEHGVRQYDAIDHAITATVKAYQRPVNLISKLLVLTVNKFSALDPYMMGVEMEAGKPGWYDALNGLPGIFGSSMAETYELSRLLDFVLRRVKQYQHCVAVPDEAAALFQRLRLIFSAYRNGSLDSFACWNEVNTAKEAYREKIYQNISGKDTVLEATEIIAALSDWQLMLNERINAALDNESGLSPCYFTYVMDEYDVCNGEIKPKHFTQVRMPDFLEGPVRYLKLNGQPVSPAEMHRRVKNSDLYDQKLDMYKVNAPLGEASYEIGRAKAFTPGWLENESIWLHMEYKYLLEILKCGLYEEFFAAFKKACIPFINAEMYGRSPLENSSFIASSANPNEKLHGKGFVARLSGSTAEFMQIWQIMMFGKSPFVMRDGLLTFAPEPAFPPYLIRDDGTWECRLLGETAVVYTKPDRLAAIPGLYTVKKIEILFSNGETVAVNDKMVTGVHAEAIRNGMAERLNITID